MKKSVLFSLYFLLPFFSFAQITINFTDLPDVGNSLWQVSDTTGAPALGGSLSGGAGQNWNYVSGWETGDSTKINFAAVSSVSNTISAQFPLANLAYDQTADSTVLFFTRNTRGMHIAGSFLYGTLDISGNLISDVAMVYTQPELIVPVPFTYNDSVASSAHRVSNVTVNSILGLITIEQKSRIVKNFKCLGYGTLSTPSGVYSDALFVKVNITSYDTTYTANPILGPQINSDTIVYSTSYVWMSNDPNQLVLMELGADSAGVTINEAYYTFKTSVSAHPDMEALSAMKFYPVPSTGLVHVEMPAGLENVQIRILSVDGKEVYARSGLETSLTTLDLSAFENGFYLMEVHTENAVRTAKLTICK